MADTVVARRAARPLDVAKMPCRKRRSATARAPRGSPNRSSAPSRSSPGAARRPRDRESARCRPATPSIAMGSIACDRDTLAGNSRAALCDARCRRLERLKIVGPLGIDCGRAAGRDQPTRKWLIERPVSACSTGRASTRRRRAAAPDRKARKGSGPVGPAELLRRTAGVQIEHEQARRVDDADDQIVIVGDGEAG